MKENHGNKFQEKKKQYIIPKTESRRDAKPRKRAKRYPTSLTTHNI